MGPGGRGGYGGALAAVYGFPGKTERYFISQFATSAPVSQIFVPRTG